VSNEEGEIVKALVLIALGITVVAIPIFSQAPAGSKPSFEAATIKPNLSGENHVAILGQPGGRFVVTGASLKMIMGVAYSVRDFQIIGGPTWITSDRWDIEAKAEEGSIPPPAGPPDPTTPNPLAIRVQSLLEDRFQLKIHHETKELPVYELTVAKGGPKMKLSEDQTPFRPPERGGAPPPPPQRGGPVPRGGMRMGRGNLEATGVPFANLVQALSQQLGRTVIDKTDLKGFYDIKLQWTPEFSPAGPLGPGGPGGPEPPPPADASGPSIFTALQEQLGLKLDSTKGPVDVIVIDSVQRPTAN
jgi:bla regulator protein blaR1